MPLPRSARLRTLFPLVLALAALSAGRPAAASAQALTIPEYRELVFANEGKLVRLDRELGAANARLDGLIAEKEAGGARGQRGRELSAEIVKASNRIAELDRERRKALTDLRALRRALEERYTAVIDANLERLGSLDQRDPAYAELLIETGRAIGARDSLQLQIRIQESLQEFREFPLLATDGPAEIREKAGFYRDYVRDVQKKIAALDREIDEIQDREQVERRMREFREDLAFQGEDAPNRPGDPGAGPSAGDLREDPSAGTGPEALELLTRPPAQRIAQLEEEKEQLELLRRRFEAKVRDYDERARTIYSRQTLQPGEQSR